MYKKFRKTAALIMAAALLVQGGISAAAEEVQPQAESAAAEAPVETPPTEAPQTQAPTEAPQTQAPTEAPQTQAPTEAPQTQTPTEAPQTQAPTEAPQTQAPTETSQTQAPAETAQTEPLTEAPQTEAATEAAESESGTRKKKAKSPAKETEKSDRENDGEKMTADNLVSGLGKALDYLFLADTVEAPEGLLEHQMIAEGADAGQMLNSLEDFSVKLANARSSTDVEVINLYADEEGRLDTAQLDEVCENQVIDVTRKYFVVNVIADSAEQNLDFSGYAMTESGGQVIYEERTQPGDILYNFAALEDGEFTDYEGTVTLAKGGGLQGTFLAPAAAVKVNSALAGAVYADTVKVADTVESLLQIGFVEGLKPETEPETAAEATETGDVTQEESTAEQKAAADSYELNAPESSGEGQDSTDPTGDGEGQDSTDPAGDGEGQDSTDPTEDGEGQDSTDPTESGNGQDSTDPSGDGDGQDSSESSGPAESKPVEVTLNVTQGDASGISTGTPVKEAVFVVKHLNEDGTYEYLKAEDDTVRKIIYTPDLVCSVELISGETYTLVQLSAETGYQIADDITITPDAEDQATWIQDIVNPQAGGTVTVTASAVYNEVVLTAAKDISSGRYVALFVKDADGSYRRASGIQELIWTQDSPAARAEFPGLKADSDYILAEVDALGEQIAPTETGDAEANPPIASQEIRTGADGKATASLQMIYPSYPENDFYYTVNITVTKEVKDEKGSPLAVGETFGAELFADAGHTSRSAVFTFAMNNTSAVSDTQTVKLTKASATFYLVENSWKGKAIDSSFPYTTTYNPAEITVSCEPSASGSATITNTKKPADVQPTIARISAQTSGKYLSGVKLVIKDSTGKIVGEPYTSSSTELELTDLKEGTYYLSEVAAPSGYAPAKDIKFTVSTGETVSAVLEHSKVSATDYKITASKQVYSGENQVYASTTSTANHTFYAALFEDKNHVVKVSDVKKITMSGLTGSVAFENLEKNKTYYIAETNSNGEPLASTSSCTIEYENGGKVKTSSKSSTTVIKNVYSSLPKGYRYTAVLTLTKKVTDSSGNPLTVSGTFYVGIYRQADYSDTPTIIKLTLDNQSSASAKRRVLLTGTTESSYKKATYYIAEVDAKGRRLDSEGYALDAQGNRLTDQSGLEYNVSIDAQQITLDKGDNKTVTVTNQQKSDNKVILYLTKRVYEGANPKKVTDTFYAGLFKDSSFTTLYTNPIPLNLKNKSEVTLKLTLNLGSAADATIYVAEVDAQGNVITDQQEFGYEIMMVNSTAAFTKDQTEVQSVLLNSVYGTSTSDDWNSIFSDNDWGDYDAVSENGVASAGTAAVQTGDTTPVGLYVLLMAAAAVVILAGILLLIRKRSKNNKK